ncbi:MAG: SIS domain-containing protein [Chloroflexota bacterium]|nr:SIS domain-containing protein [Chloroflexota bacterium]
MCGIFGYVGTPVPVDQVVLGALRAMEYRGYDSWGTAFVSAEAGRRIVRGVGRVPQNNVVDGSASSAIGHTRWATHGEVCERNAHPHLSQDGRLAVVHNGIIENADLLRQRIASSTTCVSDTDSEVMVHLVRQEMLKGACLVRAVEAVFHSIEGNNAFVVLDLHTQEAAAITHRLPIRIARTEVGAMLASDPVVFAGRATSILVLPDDLPLSLGRPNEASGSLLELERIGERVGVPELERHQRGGPGSSMRAEISEQPAVLERIVLSADAVQEAVASTASARRVVFTGCGSAYHAALFAVDRAVYGPNSFDAVAITASDMGERGHTISANDVVVALSQSGETADVIDALMAASERGATTVGVVNVSGSSVARMVDIEVPLLAGTERSVLATKSFTAMLGRMVQMVDGVAHLRRGDSGKSTSAELLCRQADEMAHARQAENVRKWIDCLRDALVPARSAFVVGTGMHQAMALEAALKLKEGAYVHAEAVRAGELKHGVIALIERGFPCLLLSGSEREAQRQAIIASELATRGASVFALSSTTVEAGDGGPRSTLLKAGSPFGQTMVAQEVALETALERGIDPDYPRNLAKSVTVR